MLSKILMVCQKYMNNLFVRLLLISFSAIGLYKVFPQISKPIDYYLKNPSFQSAVVLPGIKTANAVLPPKLQIPTPQVMGAVTEYTDSSPIKSITDEISRQAASIAASQVDQIKKTATNQFCQALLEKIKTECGAP